MPGEYVAQVADYVDRYTALMIRRLRRARIDGVLAALLSEVQSLEDAAFEVLKAFELDSAAGVQLDTVGRLLRVARGALDDEAYRFRLKVEIAILTSQGRPDDLIRVVVAGYGDFVVNYQQWEYATVVMLFLHVISTDDATTLVGYLRRAVPVGVRILLEYPTSTSRSFAFADDGLTADEASITKGFGDDADATVGGLLSGVVE